jgi:hypothetical protein
MLQVKQRKELHLSDLERPNAKNARRKARNHRSMHAAYPIRVPAAVLEVVSMMAERQQNHTGGTGVSDEDFGLQPLCIDAARDECVTSVKGGLSTGNGWIIFSSSVKQ